MTIRTLTLATGNFDKTNTFMVAVAQGRDMVCQLKRDYESVGDGIYWAMSAGTIVKDVYTSEDDAEMTRLASEAALKHGDVLMIDGARYTVKVLGPNSDCAIFEPLPVEAAKNHHSTECPDPKHCIDTVCYSERTAGFVANPCHMICMGVDDPIGEAIAEDKARRDALRAPAIGELTKVQQVALHAAHAVALAVLEQVDSPRLAVSIINKDATLFYRVAVANTGNVVMLQCSETSLTDLMDFASLLVRK